MIARLPRSSARVRRASSPNATPHTVKEVWRGTAGVLDRCQLECTCGWRSEEVGDWSRLRSAKEAHLAGDLEASPSVDESGTDDPTQGHLWWGRCMSKFGRFFGRLSRKNKLPRSISDDGDLNDD
jgi:hypothetical protein